MADVFLTLTEAEWATVMHGLGYLGLRRKTADCKAYLREARANTMQPSGYFPEPLNVVEIGALLNKIAMQVNRKPY